MAIEKERFDQILAAVLANLVDDFTALSKVPSREMLHGSMEHDVSDYGGFAGGLLAGADVNWYELEEFVRDFSVRFTPKNGISPATQKFNQKQKVKQEQQIAREAAIAKLSPEDRVLLGVK